MPITNTKAVKVCAEIINYHNTYDRELYTLIVSSKIHRRLQRYNFLNRHNKFEPEGIIIVKVK